MEKCRLVFSGSGGQGVITTAIILAEAAVLFDKIKAVQSQSYGPEARGGATRSDVIISDQQINFPKVPQPNVLVCLTQLAYNKFSTIIRPGGILITDPKYVVIESKLAARHHEIPIYKSVMDQIGLPIVCSTCLLGSVLGLTKVVQYKSIVKSLKLRFSGKILETNLKSLDLGVGLVGGFEGIDKLAM
ncbi:MAG: 2-oxoacid:acceptor oxidoreductase family protein [Desulfobacterales bacterium]|nr:2-oxoacid:acceptor oxidoreductase family protein [Desulfobacterales bacterium]